MNLNFPSKFNSVWNRLQFNAEKNPDRIAIVHWIGGQEPVKWTYGKLMETANKFSNALKFRGIEKGKVCAIILKHNPYFYPLYLGVAGIGALPSVLAYPNPRLHPEKFRQGLSGMSQRSGLNYILTERSLEKVIKPFTDDPDSTIDDLFFPLDWDIDETFNVKLINDIKSDRSSIKKEQPFLLQHSSGTTGLQKPVILSNKAILDHVSQYGAAIKLNEDDVVVSWLPLYHDMGLIGAFILPLVAGIRAVQIDPFEWVLAPILLFEASYSEKATITWLPNFAYNMLANKIHSEDLIDYSLESFRLIINASEPIRSESHNMFLKKFERFGLKKESLSTMYGMAETTLAFSQAPLDKPVKELIVDRQKLSEGIVQIANKTTPVKRICVSSGVLIDGTQMRIVDDRRNDLDNKMIGEIAVKSLSMFDGYRNYSEKTAEVIDEKGWYYTGDYGFVYEDELFVIGRKKDIIIVAGKNIYPEDVEDEINKLSNIIPGRLVAFGEEDEELGTEQVSIVAETKFETEDDLKILRKNIVRTGMNFDVNIHEVYLVPPRWLIKSSSGKPSRKTNRDRILQKSDVLVWYEKKTKRFLNRAV
ncbi:AMP-binding protein [Bacteroidota bacterium]